MVGAGLTGAMTSCLLSRSPHCRQVSLSVWERSRGAGGRMATTRWTGERQQQQADLGAQYFTAGEEDQEKHR